MRLFFFSFLFLFLPWAVFAASLGAEPYNGYTLIAPAAGGNGDDGNNEVDLIDMEGAVVHAWHLSTSETQFAELEPDGTLLTILGATSRPGMRTAKDDNARLAKIDWEGNVVWEYRDSNLHHDFALLPNGNVLGIVREPLFERYRSLIGGSPLPKTLWVDRIVEIDHATREVVWEWSEQEALDVSRYSYNGSGELFHTNAVAYLPEGNSFNGEESIMVSFREQSRIMIVDKATGDVVWEFGEGVLEHQHDPTLLENGNILVFNNRPSKKASQVLEIDPKTNAVVWTYEAPGFFSEKISGAQRLPNGNTLITEGVTGSIFEVSLAGEVVWEYQVGESEKDDRSVFRAYRYGVDAVDAMYSSSSDVQPQDSEDGDMSLAFVSLVVGFFSVIFFVFLKIRRV